MEAFHNKCFSIMILTLIQGSKMVYKRSFTNLVGLFIMYTIKVKMNRFKCEKFHVY